MKIKYQSTNFAADKLAKINTANEIIEEYTAKGFGLTLRQLYYQFVSRGLIPNNEREYKKLGDAVSDGRMAGLLDWNMITDRMRQIERTTTWSDPAEILSAVAKQFKLPKWDRQPYYVEAWIEKDALVGVIEPTCRDLEIPYMACRGYMSISSIWEAGYERFKPQLQRGKECLLLYLGDHDPSGIDMTRDIFDRMKTFAGSGVTVQRLALSYDQVQEFNPPPNPTKLTDSRAGGYLAEYGETCWELDALEPEYIANLVEEAVLAVRDEELWDEAMGEQEAHREDLRNTANYWDQVAEFTRKRFEELSAAEAEDKKKPKK